MKCDFCKSTANVLYKEEGRASCCAKPSCRINAALRMYRKIELSLSEMGIPLEKFHERVQKEWNK